jgi:hypothetical protein
MQWIAVGEGALGMRLTYFLSAVLATIVVSRAAAQDFQPYSVLSDADMADAAAQPALDWQTVIRGQEEGEDEEDPIATDRPDFTEASSIVPLGMLQLESGYTFIYDDDNASGVLTRSHSAPEILLRYGATELFELRLVWNYVWERSIEAGMATDSDGAEDVTLGTKVFLLTQEEWIPEASIVFHIVAPTGAEAFSNRNAEFETNLLYGWDLPYDWSLGASTGYSTATEIQLLLVGPLASEVEDRHNVFHQSVTIGAPWTDELRSYLEYFGLYFDGLSGGRPEHYVDGGFTYLLNNDTQLDIRAGHGLSSTADDFFAGVGFSVRN